MDGNGFEFKSRCLRHDVPFVGCFEQVKLKPKTYYECTLQNAVFILKFDTGVDNCLSHTLARSDTINF